MPTFYWISSQQPASHLPSRGSPAQENSCIQSGVIALIVTGAIAISVVSLLGFKQYQQYRYRKQIKTLERLWHRSTNKKQN